MLSPRHRYNRAALFAGMKPEIDGLTNRAAPDELTRALEAELKKYKGGPLKAAPKQTAKQRARGLPPPTTALFPRAYEAFKQQGARRNFDAILLATLSVADSAKVLRESEELVQTYADYFFDIEVFGGSVGRIVYLDALYKSDPDYATMLRNMLSVPLEQLLFIVNSSTGEKLEPKTVLEVGMSMHYNFMRLFSQVKLETVMAMSTDSDDFKRFKELFSMAVTSSTLAHKFAETLLKYDLDKDRVNFLDEFILNLTNKGLSHYISSPATEELDLV